MIGDRRTLTNDEWLVLKKNLFERVKYEPHWKQKELHYYDENPDYKNPWTFMVACWGRRSGKSLCAAMECIAHLIPPGNRVWVVAPTYALTEKVFREVYQLLVIDKILGEPKKVLETANMNIRGGHMLIRTKWGSWIEGKSAENPNSLVGEGLDFLVIDEAAKINPRVWEQYLEPTLLDRHGRCLMITTPEGHNWLWEKYEFGFAEDRVANGWQCSHMKSRDNPYLDKEWIANKRKEVTPEVYRQEYEASFEHHTGLIFPEFSGQLTPEGHGFKDELLIHLSNEDYENMTWYRGVDPGSDNPTACLIAGVNKLGDVFVTDEYKEEGLLAETHAGAISILTKYPVEQTFIDPAATRRSATDGESVQDRYSVQGIFTYPANNDVTYGLQSVARYIRATLEDHPTHPRVYIHQRCIELRRELSRYVWDDWRSLMEKNKPDKPRKYDDHLVDCLRYILSAKPEYVDPYFHEEIIEPTRRPPKPGRPTTGL